MKLVWSTPLINSYPICDTSNNPHDSLQCKCSFNTPKGYYTGISYPANGTILPFIPTW